MRHRTIALFLACAASFSVGALTGYRARISEEEVFVPPPVPRTFAIMPTPTATAAPRYGIPEPPLSMFPDIVVERGPTLAAPSHSPSASPVTSPGAGTVERNTRVRRSHQQRGYATWYGTGRNGFYAAAGPVLRRALGSDWRGSRVLVCKQLRCVEVRLNDWCACGKRNGEPTLLDLSDEAFRYLAPLSRGVIRVAVGW